MKLNIPELSLVVLIGASGAGKSTFARKHFQRFEVLSSDFCRELVTDDENNQSASKDAFDVLRYITAKRLAAGKLTVVDATNLHSEDRKGFVQLARQYHFFPVAIALNIPEELCHQHNQQRADYQIAPHVVHNHTQSLRRSLRGLEREGFRYVYILSSQEEINAVEVERQPLWNNRKHEHGPFDIIGDIHGCCKELEALLQKLGYVRQESKNIEVQINNSSSSTSPLSLWDAPTYYHPQGRKAIFLGDLIDRGPHILDTVKLVRNMVVAGNALCVPGNHENKLLRKLRGKNVKVNHGLEQTLAEIEALPEEVRELYTRQLKEFFDVLVSHYVLDDGRLVVAHAGMKQEFQGRGSAQVREFALYGETIGEIDEFGLPVRHNWAAEYRGGAMVVYGHTPVPEAEWLNNTINIDTGCVFGGKLTALRYPEKELVSIRATRNYCEPIKPISGIDSNELRKTGQHKCDDLLNIDDVLSKRTINTYLVSNITISSENAIAALEVMSRFAVNPKWLIYLPPTMPPVESSQLPGYLEHPQQAFAYYRNQGIMEVVCEEKHRGSRAVVIVCRDETVANKRFGIVDESIGICYTRTGRRFFENAVLEMKFLERLNIALARSSFWEKFNTDWVCLDCELMPWSPKAEGVVREQYAAVGVASRVAFNHPVSISKKSNQSGVDVSTQLSSFQQRGEIADQYVNAYRRYCWPINDISDFKLAPFHILATEKTTHINKDHYWHIEEAANIALHDPDMLSSTAYKVIDLTDPSSQAEGVQWWEELTAMGGEGIVVKPVPFIIKGSRGIIQPAIKCRGREYLRMIYGSKYDLPENLQRLRQRGLSLKRSLAVREFALGIEALERFVNYTPLRHVYECVFGILALENEAVDPRL